MPFNLNFRSLTHNSTVSKNEPVWGTWIKNNESKLPDNAFADEKARSYPHHWVDNPTEKNSKFTGGTMYLSEGGLKAAWAAAMGAHTGKKASREIIDHLEAHRKALGWDKKKAISDDEVFERAANVVSGDDGKPSTLDREKRTIDIVAASEKPILVRDWNFDEGIVPETLLMSGFVPPSNNQTPMQDTHDRFSIQSTIGSVRNFQVKGPELHATAHFSKTPEGESAFTKYEEGHLTDFSVSWKPLDPVVRIQKGATQIVAGRSFTGPARIVPRWTIGETSACPIGGDVTAKARAKYTLKETDVMNEDLKKELIRLGLKFEATDEEALAFLRALNIPELDTTRTGQEKSGTESAEQMRASITTEVRNAYVAESTRIESIRTLCAKHETTDLEAEMIRTGVSVDQAARTILDKISTRQPAGGLSVPAGSVELQADAGDKFCSAVIYSLLIDRGAMQIKNLPEAPGHEVFRSYTLREIARECLRFSGKSMGGNVMEMIGRALTTSDLPAILADVANKALQTGFALADETFDIWTDTLPVNDFKALHLVSVSNLDDLVAISQDGEFKYGYFKDKQETATLGTAGRIYPVSRQAIINDDLNAITVVFSAAGLKARKYEGDLVYAILTANPTMTEDGNALFDAVNHLNVGTAGLPDIDTMNQFDALLGAMKGVNNEMLNIPLTFIICPRSMKGQAESFFMTQQFLLQDSRQNNPWFGNVVQRVYEPRLSANSAIKWYGAGPKTFTIVRTHLNGIQTPYTEQMTGWKVDGVELKVRYDVAAAARDWRGMLYNPGR